MSDAMILRMIALFGGKPFLTAPSHCPLYPHNTLNTPGPAFQLMRTGSQPPALQVQNRSPLSYRALALSARLRSHSGLSPPISQSI